MRDDEHSDDRRQDRRSEKRDDEYRRRTERLHCLDSQQPEKHHRNDREQRPGITHQREVFDARRGCVPAPGACLGNHRQITQVCRNDGDCEPDTEYARASVISVLEEPAG
jgi:hypothetical protein